VTGAAGLTYTWKLESGPADVSVAPNGSTTASNAVVTFAKAGTYVIRCTLQNANGSDFQTTSATTLPQVLKTITVSPNNVTIKTVDNQTFTAQGFDQFGNSMTLSSVAWSSTSGGISQAGIFRSGSLGSNIRVTATSGGVSGSSIVNVISFDISGAIAYPVPYKSTQGNVIHFKGLGSDSKIRIYTVTGRLVFSTEVLQDTFDWNVKNGSGENLASGVYLYVIESPTSTKNGKLIIIQ
jgi:PKD repeat protein